MDRVFLIGRDEIPQHIRLGEAGELHWTFVALPGTSADVKLEVDLCAEGISLDLAGLYLCRADERLRLDITVRHLSGGCISRQLFKGIVGGKAHAAFDGLIYVKKDAQKTKAYQENHTILLSDTATIDTRPQLEIYADDVECSHGATTGFLNADEEFYMRSRGIPRDEARRLQMISFLSPVLSRLDENMAQGIMATL